MDFIAHADTERSRQDHNPWAELSDEEQEIIAGKLVVGEGETAQQVFSRLINESGNTSEAVLNVKNFIDAVGGHSNTTVWQQIDKIVQITGEGSLLHVTLGDKFLEAAAAAVDMDGNPEYVINDYWDKRLAQHDYDTIRQTTQYSGLEADKPAYPIHFANDLGGNRYFAHFDSTSSFFRSPGCPRWNPLYRVLLLKERIKAARIHGDPSRRPEAARVRDYLRSTGKIPSGES